MASGPITSWEIDGETVQTVSDFIFGGSKITADGDCSHEIKRHLLLGGKVMTNLDSIFKSRDITLPTKVHIVSYGFSSSHVQIWELNHKEGWAPKNWCFQIVVLVRFMRVPWTARRSNQSILKETNPEYAPILWSPAAKSWLIGKNPHAGKDRAGEEGGDREWDCWLASPTQWTWVRANSGR